MSKALTRPKYNPRFGLNYGYLSRQANKFRACRRKYSQIKCFPWAAMELMNGAQMRWRNIINELETEVPWRNAQWPLIWLNNDRVHNKGFVNKISIVC